MTAKINFMASAIMISSTYLVGYYSNQLGKNLAKYKSNIIKEELMTNKKLIKKINILFIINILKFLFF